MTNMEAAAKPMPRTTAATSMTSVLGASAMATPEPATSTLATMSTLRILCPCESDHATTGAKMPIAMLESEKCSVMAPRPAPRASDIGV